MNPEVQTYFEAAPEAFKPLFLRFQNLILQLYPQAEITLSYKIPTYRYGRGWVALGFRKDGVSLYTCGLPNIADFKAKHPQIKSGAGCLNFRLRDSIPEEDLIRVIHNAMNQTHDGSSCSPTS